MSGLGVMDDWEIGVMLDVGSREHQKEFIDTPDPVMFLVNVSFIIQFFHINFLVIN